MIGLITISVRRIGKDVGGGDRDLVGGTIPKYFGIEKKIDFHSF